VSERPHLYHRFVAPEELAATLEALRATYVLDYLYWESEATIELTAYRTPDPAWSHGRAFGPSLEVRWQRTGEGFEMLLLTERPLPLPQGWQPLPEATAGGQGEADTPFPYPDSVDSPAQVLLWGTHIRHLQHPHRLAGGEGDVWIETRIPRPLRYPVRGAPPWVKARVITYRYRGRPVLTRLVSLEGEKHEPETSW